MTDYFYPWEKKPSGDYAVACRECILELQPEIRPRNFTSHLGKCPVCNEAGVVRQLVVMT